MSTLSELYSKKRRYKNLKKDVEDIIDYLTNSIHYINEASNNIRNSYLINNENGDSNRIRNIKDEMEEQKRILKNTICQEIIRKINKLDNQINDEESE